MEEEIIVIGEVPETPPTGGGGGGGTPTPRPPTPQELRPDPEEEQPEISNPADDATDADIGELKSCWEKKAKKKLKKNGWNPDATTAATWTIDRLTETGFGRTKPEIKVVDGKNRLVMNVDVFATNIGATAGGLIDWLWQTEDEPPTSVEYKLAFRHLTTYTYMHEPCHVSQLLKTFKDRETMPDPLAWWELEVEAHAKSTQMWVALYDDPPPSALRTTTDEYREHASRYEAKKTEYLNLEKELADPDTTPERKAVIETKLKKLKTELKDPANLPQAQNNELYTPEGVENFECD